MTFRSFLYREARWMRHNAASLVLILIVLPAMFAGAMMAFQQAIPRDTPVGVAPASDAVDDNATEAVAGIATTFSRPHTYDSPAAAKRALAREEVYAVFVVPEGLLERGDATTIRMIVEREMVPYEQPSLAIRSILDSNVRTFIPSTSVVRTPIGQDKTLSEFLVSAAVMLLAMVYAFVLLPHVVASERDVYRRIRATSSLWKLLAAKFATFSALMLIPIVGAQAVANEYAKDVALLAPAAVGVTLLTFLYLSAIAVAVMFLFRFGTVGRLVNISLLLGGVVFGSMIYPAGFFSPIRRTIAKHLPLHYSMIVQRGVSLKGYDVGLYADYVAMLVGFTVVALGFLYASVRFYERRA